MSDFAVGLTGGIASGKSTVDRAFSALGVAVVDADAIARDIVAPGQPALSEIVAHFGAASLAPDGSLDRPAMRHRVFGDPRARLELEAITHPRIRAELRRRCACATGPYVIASIPLLAEAGATGAYDWLRRILVVDCPESLQLERLVQRDGVGLELATRMVAAQVSRRARLSRSTDVVVNDGSLAVLVQSVERLDRRFRAMAA